MPLCQARQRHRYVLYTKTAFNNDQPFKMFRISQNLQKDLKNY